MKRHETMERPPVLIFANSFRAGGSERQALELIRGLDRSRFKPLVACFDEGGPLSKELDGFVDDIASFPLTSFYDSNALRQAIRFADHLKQNDVQILQCFDFYSNIFAIPLARVSGVPVILGGRRNERSLRTKAQRSAERGSFALATGVVTNTERLKEELTLDDGVSPRKVWTIPNGLDVERFDRWGRLTHHQHRRRRDGLTIAVVANLRPEKGHLVFLEAVYRVASRFPDTHFLLAGDGAMRSRIEERIGDLRLARWVQMMGAVENVPAFLRDVDIVVSPSDTEGFPNAVMEGMAASKPVVATDVGGTCDLVREGVTGFLVEKGNVESMAERITTLCLDGDVRQRMGEAGRRLIEDEFTTRRMTQAFEAMYTRLIAERRAKRRSQSALLPTPRVDLGTGLSKDS